MHQEINDRCKKWKKNIGKNRQNVQERRERKTGRKDAIRDTESGKKKVRRKKKKRDEKKKKMGRDQEIKKYREEQREDREKKR